MSVSNRRFPKTGAAGLALALSLAFFRCTGGTSCIRNSDCPAHNVCSQGACALPPAEMPADDAGADASDAAPDARPDSGRGGAGGAPSGGGGGEGGASEQ
jgi:hypothetical protein